MMWLLGRRNALRMRRLVNALLDLTQQFTEVTVRARLGSGRLDVIVRDTGRWRRTRKDPLQAILVFGTGDEAAEGIRSRSRD